MGVGTRIGGNMFVFVFLLALGLALGMWGYNRFLAKPCNC